MNKLTIFVVVCFIEISTCIDVSVFQRVFNETGLTDQQIQQIGKLYNEGLQQSKAKKTVLNYIKKNDLSDDVKEIFLKTWNDELFLRQLSNESFSNVEYLMTDELREQVLARKEEMEKKYKGDFAKVQLDLVRFIQSKVAPEEKEKVAAKLNEPLQKFKTPKKMEKLKSAIHTFQIED